MRWKTTLLVVAIGCGSNEPAAPPEPEPEPEKPLLVQMREGQGDPSAGDAFARAHGFVKPTPAERPQGTVKVGEPPEGMSQGIAARVVRYVPQIRTCYLRRLADKPDLAGSVTLAWIISGQRATAARVTADTTGDEGLSDCIVDRMAQWSFPGSEQIVVDGWSFELTTSTKAPEDPAPAEEPAADGG